MSFNSADNWRFISRIMILLAIAFGLGVLHKHLTKHLVQVDTRAAELHCVGIESSDEWGWRREHKADQRGVPLDDPGVEYKRRVSVECYKLGDESVKFQAYEGWWRKP